MTPINTSEDSKTVSIALRMREEAGNEYQDKSLVSIDLELKAVQLAYENQYDNVVYATPDTLQRELDNAVENTVIYLKPGTYEDIQLKTATTDKSITHNIKNLKIVGGEGVVVDGLAVISDSHNGWTVDGLTIENVNFRNKGFYINQADGNRVKWPEMPNLTMRNCTFVGTGDGNESKANRLLGYNGQTNTKTFKNLLIEGCIVNNAHQGIYVLKADSATIRNCTFENIEHNAIALQTSVNGNNIIEGNTIKNCTDRAFRLGVLISGSTVTYKNNTLQDSGDDTDNGTNFKANTLQDGSTVKFEGNKLNNSSWPENVILNGPLTDPTDKSGMYR